MSIVPAPNSGVSIETFNSDMLMPAFSVQEAARRHKAIIDYVSKLLVPGQDYGIVPGTSRKDPQTGEELAKNTLYLPGAQKLCSFFALTPIFEVEDKEKDWTGERHRDKNGNPEPFFAFDIKCKLYRGSYLVAEGNGHCNSWEKKYRYREAKRLCPECQQPTLNKSKKRPDGSGGKGYYCWQKIGGCGQQFDSPDLIAEIERQEVGQIPNPDIADVVNTVRKIADKRAFVAAILTATGASQFFTQDLEDLYMDRLSQVLPAPPRIASVEEAEDRFWQKFAGIVGGAEWEAVQLYLNDRQRMKPTTIDGWIEAGKFLNDAVLAKAALQQHLGPLAEDMAGQEVAP